jgi:7-carboxy-7-deazaguanine synthase
MDQRVQARLAPSARPPRIMHEQAATPDVVDRTRLPIAETFVSLQGEGVLTGVPSWFCRVSGCNLRCVWCDTPYASWQPEGGPRSVESLLEEARASGVKHAVLTGGEPMLFPAIEPLARGLRTLGVHITIESAGTIDRSPVCDLMSLSPKLAHSTPSLGDARDPLAQWPARHEARRLNTGALQVLIDRYPSRQLKFVVASPADLAEIEGVLAQLQRWKPGEILLMPEGTSTPSPESIQWLIGACIDRGYRLCSRQHLQWFGHRRGT